MHLDGVFRDTGRGMQAPERPKDSFRITLTLSAPKKRLDSVLLEELRKQTENQALKTISRTAFKALFQKKKIQIKGQAALPSSSLTHGVTHVDILGINQLNNAAPELSVDDSD